MKRIKRWPPIAYVLLPVVFPFMLAYVIIGWLIGFWACDVCGKVYGIKTSRTSRVEWGGETTLICEHCERGRK